MPDVPASSAKPSPADISYAERLLVPVGWWLLTLLFALSLFVAVFFYLGPWFAVGAGLLVLAVTVPLWISYGGTRVVIARDRLWAGRASIEWRYLSDVQSLDAIQTRKRRGPAADARAFLVLRPYLDQAVEVTLCDPQDATPYWLIGSRTPNRMANNIRARMAEAHPSKEDPATDSTADDGGEPGNG